MSDVSSPAHYGGEDNPYETIKVIEAWELGFSLGNAVKYISRAGKKIEAPPDSIDAIRTEIKDLRKAIWYLERHILQRIDRVGEIERNAPEKEKPPPPALMFQPGEFVFCAVDLKRAGRIDCSRETPKGIFYTVHWKDGAIEERLEDQLVRRVA